MGNLIADCAVEIAITLSIVIVALVLDYTMGWNITPTVIEILSSF